MADWLAEDFRGGMGLSEEQIEAFLTHRNLDLTPVYILDYQEVA